MPFFLLEHDVLSGTKLSEFAIAGDFCRKLPFARNFSSEAAISFAKPFAFVGEFIRNAQFAAFL